jgi:2-polyprenyl-3-methyl-5-hydroxy-6-metoxy-1,4-benzoquinol methylase
MSPLCQTHIAPEQLHQMEPFYPLHVYTCAECFLVQLPEHVAPAQIFEEYAYFSSYSDTMLQHACAYVDMVTSQRALTASSLVVELASNDGYLLQYFAAKGIPVLGIEPARNVARAAIDRGLPTISEFFGRALAARLIEEGHRADLIVGNNVLAHVPDLHDFVGGMQALLKPDGLITMEFPHLTRLVDNNLFDTIYHEHFSYLSLTTVARIFAAHALTIFDVEEVDTHGGSLRIYASHAGQPQFAPSHRLSSLKEREAAWGVERLSTYAAFGERVKTTKRKILRFLIDARESGKTVAAYGAPGKGNTLLNYCGIGTDLLDFTVDRNPYKQGKFTPGTRIPIHAPEHIRMAKPDFLFILPWNLKREIIEQNLFIREWGGRFVVPLPELEVLEGPE